MKKLIMAIVCLMTIMMCFTSCNRSNVSKFNLVTDNIAINTPEWIMVEKALDNLENYFYLNSKYDLDYLSYLKTKIQVHTDSLVVGEIYTRGRNSFDGGTAQHNVFIYYENSGNIYFDFLSADAIVPLVMRAEVENTLSNKNYIFVRYVKKHGDLNDETCYENLVRNNNGDDIKDLKFFKKYFDKELGINTKK